MKTFLFVLGCVVSLGPLAGQSEPQVLSSFKHSFGPVWHQVSDSKWIQSQKQWFREWTLDQIKGGFVFLSLEPQGFSLAIPLAGGPGYICHKNQEIWLPYPGEFRWIIPPRNSEKSSGSSIGP